MDHKNDDDNDDDDDVVIKKMIQTFSPLVAVPKSFTAVTFTVVKNFISTAPAPK